MRINILSKFLILVLLLTVIPLGILGTISISYVQEMEYKAAININEMKNSSIGDVTNALNDLGRIIIKNQAISTAKMVELYMLSHPNKTVEDFMNDSEFQSIGIQPVGTSGYTCVAQPDTQTLVAHPNGNLIGISIMHWSEEEEMQEWWSIAEPTISLQESEGYYTWKEQDGSYSKKYMYVAIVNATTADGIHLSIPTTTYIDDFNQPADDIESELDINSNFLISDINNTRQGLQQSVIAILFVIVIIVVIISILYTRTITNPIKKLKETVKRIADGDLSLRSDLRSRDEIGDLATHFNQMAESLAVQRKKLENYNKNLEKRIKERTKDLEKSKKGAEEKNMELERFNKLAVGRELKMINLKKRIKELEKGK